MTQPKLYCTCGATAIDENGVEANNALSCSNCARVRCSKCMWPHLRKCDPSKYQRLRTALLLRQINEQFQILGKKA